MGLWTTTVRVRFLCGQLDAPTSPQLNICGISLDVNTYPVLICQILRVSHNSCRPTCCRRGNNSCMILFCTECLLVSKPDVLPHPTDISPGVCPCANTVIHLIQHFIYCIIFTLWFYFHHTGCITFIFICGYIKNSGWEVTMRLE